MFARVLVAVGVSTAGETVGKDRDDVGVDVGAALDPVYVVVTGTLLVDADMDREADVELDGGTDTDVPELWM
jgi:hypothetical protein